MKLKLKSNSGIVTSNNIQNKVNSILAMDLDNTLNTDNNKGNNNMKLKLKSNNETDNNTENSPLNKLKLKKGLNSDNLEMSIDKFSRVNDIMVKLDNLDNTFTTFLNNQNDSLKVVNNFSNRLDTFETIFSNILKNQKSILNAINTLHGKLIKPETDTTYYQNNKPETKLIKAKDKIKPETETDIESIDGIFNLFQSHFGNNNFLGSATLIDSNQTAFTELIQEIDIESIDTITESIKKFRSQYYKDNNKYLTARKSNNAFINAMVKTIESINGKAFNIAESQSNSETIDKGYFAKIFKTDKNTISELIDEIKSINDIDSNIDAISEYLKELNPDSNNNMIGLFVNYVKAYMD